MILAAGLLFGTGAHAKAPPDTLDASALLALQYRIVPDVIFLTAGGWNAKLDLYLPLHAGAPSPTFIYLHGGGWVTGSKDEASLEVLPLLSMGFAVLNVDYRLAQTAQAPAAVEDCRCALRWVFRHAQQYGFDLTRVVIGGMSAGGHLALLTAMAPTSAGFDRLCPGNEDLRVAAVVNFFGIVDVPDVLTGPHARDFATGWLGGLPDGARIARSVSPIEYVRPLGPPVITVHGDADPVVPYQHALRLRQALDQAGVANQLITVKGGKHGDFSGRDVIRSFRAVRQFLIKHGVLPPPN
jgi:acetyl esterase/lipase